MTDTSNFKPSPAKIKVSALRPKVKNALAAIGAAYLKKRALKTSPTARVLTCQERLHLEGISACGPLTQGVVFPQNLDPAQGLSIASLVGRFDSYCLPSDDYDALRKAGLINASGYLTAAARLSLAAEV